MFKVSIITTIFSVLFLMFTSSLAQPMRGYLIDKLDLTEKQLNDIQKLRDNHLKIMSDYRSELQKLAIDIRSEWRNPAPDKKKIESLMDKMNEIRNKMNKQRLNHWFEVYNLLDEKQKVKFKEFREDFFKDRFFGGPKFKREFFFRKGFGLGLGPCGAGLGPWWDK